MCLILQLCTLFFLLGCYQCRFRGNWGECKIQVSLVWEIDGSKQLDMKNKAEWEGCDILSDMGDITWDTPDDPNRVFISGSNNNTGPPYNPPRIEGDMSGLKLTLIMTDLDWPSRVASSVGAETIHWLAVNIPHTSLRGGKIMEGDQWVKYLPPFPQATTDYHRIVFLIYAQSGDLTLDSDDPYPLSDCFCTSPPCADCPDLMRRMNFNTKRFAEKYNLRGPVGGNFALVDSACSSHVSMLLWSGIVCLYALLSGSV